MILNVFYGTMYFLMGIILLGCIDAMMFGFVYYLENFHAIYRDALVILKQKGGASTPLDLQYDLYKKGHHLSSLVFNLLIRRLRLEELIEEKQTKSTRTRQPVLKYVLTQKKGWTACRNISLASSI